MFCHAAIRFLHGPRLPGCGNVASIMPAKSSIDHKVALSPAAIAGERPGL
jgi:hypothetical protein